MNRRVFMKSGAMALATMGLNPTFLRRTVFAQDLLKGAARCWSCCSSAAPPTR
jgi:hypothetical protein